MSEEESNIERIKAGKSIFNQANFSEQQLVDINKKLSWVLVFLFWITLLLILIYLQNSS
jgi:hypothetical protein